MTPVDDQLLSELRLCVRCFNVRGSVIAAAAAAAAAVAAAAAAAANRNDFAAGTQGCFLCEQKIKVKSYFLELFTKTFSCATFYV